MGAEPDIAVLVPCLDEESTVGQVVAGFKAALPDCTVYVYDNGSTDRTVERARTAGAVIRTVEQPGKGNVVRRMFSDIDAGVYLIVDGDGTYDPSDAPALVGRLVEGGFDMVVGARSGENREAHRVGHAFGNRAFNRLYRLLFGSGFSDLFSGYRAFSSRFVKSFPAGATGFEIETEMSVHASQLRLPIAEVPVRYLSRAEGSSSKLRTTNDGFRILWNMVVMLKDNRPLSLFGWLAAGSSCAALGLGVPVVVSFSRTGLVERLPTALLATGLAVAGLVLWAMGLILDSVARGRVETKRLAYLQAN